MADYAESLFQSIDAIVTERIHHLPYDRTIIATIVDNTNAYNGRYEVTTDNNTRFYAYSSNPNYAVKERVYVRIPEGDYTKQKVIVDKYIAKRDVELNIRNAQYYPDSNNTDSNISYTNTFTGVSTQTFEWPISNTSNAIVGYSCIGITFDKDITFAQIDLKGYNTSVFNVSQAETTPISYTNITFKAGVEQSLSLNALNLKAITFTPVAGTAISMLKGTLTLGYLLSATDVGTLALFMYNKNPNATMYYNPESISHSFSLGLKLLSINQGVATQINTMESDVVLGIYSDEGATINSTPLSLSYSSTLKGDYALKTFNTTTDIFNSTISIQIAPIKQLNKTVVCQAYTIINNAIILSNIYTLYGNANLSKDNYSFTLQLIDVPVFIYDTNRHLTNSSLGGTNTPQYICRILFQDFLTNSTTFPAGVTVTMAATGIVTITGRNGSDIYFTIATDPSANQFITSRISITLSYNGNQYETAIEIPYVKGLINQTNFKLTATELSLGTNGNLLQYTNSGLTLGGAALTTGAWGGNAATATLATTATELATAPSFTADGNNIKITAGGKTSDAFTIPYATAAGKINTNAGSLTTPVYFTNGVPAVITSIDETLLGFNTANNGFSDTNTKLYKWLKAIQTNMNTLASQHSGITLNWPATL